MIKSITKEIIKANKKEITPISNFLYDVDFIKKTQLERVSYLKKLNGFIMSASFGLPIDMEAPNTSTDFIKHIDGVMLDVYSHVPLSDGYTKEVIVELFKSDYAILLNDLEFMKSYVDYNYSILLNFVNIPLLRSNTVSVEFADYVGADIEVFKKVCRYMIDKRQDFSDRHWDMIDFVLSSNKSKDILFEFLDSGFLKVTDVFMNNHKYNDEMKKSITIGLVGYFKKNKEEFSRFIGDVLENPRIALNFTWFFEEKDVLKLLNIVSEYKNVAYKVLFYNSINDYSLHSKYRLTNKDVKDFYKSKKNMLYNGKDHINSISDLDDGIKLDVFFDVVDWMMQDKYLLRRDKMPKEFPHDSNSPYIFLLLSLLEIKDWSVMTLEQKARGKEVFSKIFKRLTVCEWDFLTNTTDSCKKKHIEVELGMKSVLGLIGISYNNSMKMDEKATNAILKTVLSVFRINKYWVTDAYASSFFEGLQKNFGFDGSGMNINAKLDIGYPKFKALVEKNILQPVSYNLLNNSNKKLKV